jgi:phosphoglucosamine mutase
VADRAATPPAPSGSVGASPAPSRSGGAPSAPRLFGTDGVRGVAGEFLSADLALSLGRAAAASRARGGREAVTPQRAETPQVLIVRDTRESGEMLEAALAAGVAAAGGHALLAGVLPTPAAALLVRRFGLDMAVVVSASHNPYRDNGLKFFGPDGTKLPDEEERRVEALVADPPAAPTSGLGRVRRAVAWWCDRG